MLYKKFEKFIYLLVYSDFLVSTKHENAPIRPLEQGVLHPLTHRPQEAPLRPLNSTPNDQPYLYKGENPKTPLKKPNKTICPLSCPLT